MNNNCVVQFEDVSKIYKIYSSPQKKLLELIFNKNKKYSYEKNALDNISFTLKKGSRLGVIGENGSGKSTLLKLLANVLTPTKGSVQVKGRVSALLELGAGFNPELQGLENIRQFCMLHGMNSDETNQAISEIIKFSELGDAINQPVKTYSSGMSVRLGFSCAVYVKPDILIVDEALSVGDAYFQNKCLHKIKSLLDLGTSFIYVTHATDSIRTLCNEAIWLENGKLKLLGNSKDVGAAYQASVYKKMVGAGIEQNISSEKKLIETNDLENYKINAEKLIKFEERIQSQRTGTGESKIQYLEILNENNIACDSVEFNKNFKIRIYYKNIKLLPNNTAITVGIVDKNGKQILHFNSLTKNIYLNTNSITTNFIEIDFDNYLCPGEYNLIAGIGTFIENPKNNGQYLIDVIVDYCAGGSRFLIDFPFSQVNNDLWGVFNIPYSIKIGTI